MLNVKHNKPAKVRIRINTNSKDINEILEEKINDKERKRTENSFRKNRG